MELTLISPYDLNVAYGLRKLSSYLKLHGHKVNMIFLSSGEYNQDFTKLYDQEVLEDISKICNNSKLIGISLMSNYFLQSRQITTYLKSKFKIPIIWGGIHPTIRPEECLKYADYIFRGESDDSFLEFVEKFESKQDISNIQNLGYIVNGTIKLNELRELNSELDEYPPQDYDISTHYVIQNKRLVKIDEDILKKIIPVRKQSDGKILYEYYTHTSRGCPHKCTYCCNFRMSELYSNKGKYLRKRSVNNIINELKNIILRFKFINLIIFTDDTFLIRPIEEIKDFALKYKSKINIPFEIYTSPVTTDYEKLKLLFEAGLSGISMGIQSGSKETNFNIYGRYTSNELVLRAASTINKFSDKLNHPPIYHIIINNPFETNKNLLETLDLILQLPKPFRLFLFPLVFYPGTQLYDKAKSLGIIKNDLDDIYIKSWGEDRWKENNYLTYILYFISRASNTQFLNLALYLSKLFKSNVFIFLFDNKYFLTFLLCGAKTLRKIKSISK